MPASPYSSNVILAKARAMYGRCLTAQDFHNLLACHSVSAIASYLKTRTAYACLLYTSNGPKNQNTWGAQGGSPWRFFSPFLCVKKGGAQARPVFAGRVGVCPHI